MNKNYLVSRLKTQLRLLVLSVFATAATTSYAQLSGTKTLGTGGDYTTWANLATAISSNGVSGDLTVEVISDLTSSASITLKNNATNPTSSTKKITIDGKGKKLTSNHNDAALVLDGIDYLTLKDYTIDQATTSSDVKGIQFMGGANYNTIDGVKIEFDNEWVHLRKSNTEPIIRIYSESKSLSTAEHLANKIIQDIREIIAVGV